MFINIFYFYNFFVFSRYDMAYELELEKFKGLESLDKDLTNPIMEKD